MASRINELAKFNAAASAFHATIQNLGVPAEGNDVRRGDGDAPVTTAVTRPARSTERRRRMTTSQTTQPLATNAPTFESLLAVATELGMQAGQGQDTQIKFDLKVIEGAYLGSLDTQPDKHGKGRRDGMVLAEAYVKARQGSVIFDAKVDKSRKLISNVDKCIKLGGNPKWGVGQPLQNVNELITFRQQERKDPTKAKRLDDAHNMLMRYATAQLKSDTLIDGEALHAYAYKQDPNEVMVEDVLEAIRKKAMALQKGQIAHCNGVLNTPEVQKIVEMCTKGLTAIAKARAPGASQTP